MKNSQASRTVAAAGRATTLATMIVGQRRRRRAEEEPARRQHAAQAAVVVHDVEVDDPAGRRMLAEPVEGLAGRLSEAETGEVVPHTPRDGITEGGRQGGSLRRG